MSAFSALFSEGVGAALTGVGSILSPVLSMFGQQDANKQNIELARENREFQERMANTEVQRRAADLEAAGFNRLLALGNGASSPSGSVAHVQNPMDAFKNNPLNILALQRSKAEIDKTKAETAVQSVLAQNQFKEGLLKDLALQYGLVNKKYREAELERLQGMTPWEIRNMQWKSRLNEMNSAVAGMRGELMQEQWNSYRLENEILRMTMPHYHNLFEIQDSLYGRGMQWLGYGLGQVGNLLGPAATYFKPSRK